VFNKEMLNDNNKIKQPTNNMDMNAFIMFNNEYFNNNIYVIILYSSQRFKWIKTFHQSNEF